MSLAALYAKVNHTEPPVLRALVQGSAPRLKPVRAAVGQRESLPGWSLRMVDGNHLPGSEKRQAPLRSERGERGAALPGPTLVVYDPDAGWVTDLVACEDAYESEHTAAATLVAGARPGELWIADRHFCTRTLLQGWEEAKACFIVREPRRPPKLEQEGVWEDAGACDTGLRQVQPIGLSANELRQ